MINCDNICAKIAQDQLFDCDQVIIQGIEQSVLLFNRCDISNYTTDVSQGSPAVSARGTLTASANPSNNDSVTLNGKIYTFQSTLTDVDGNVLIGAAASDTIENLVAAVNLSAGAGTAYAASTTIHPTMTAVVGQADTVVFIAKTAGVAGNALTTVASGTGLSFGAATLEGGLDGVAAQHRVTALTLNSGAQGYLIQGVQGKNIFTAGHTININEDAPDDFSHTISLRAYNLTEENLVYVRNLGRGADLVAITLDRTNASDEDKYKVYGLDFGLKVGELAQNTAENRGAIVYTLTSRAPDFESFPPYKLLISDIASTDALYNAKFAS